MKSIEISVNNEKIFGILHEPQNNNVHNKNVLIVFLHGWAGYRIGPHQMFVKMARRLADKGYYAFRFDFRGKGYSEGNSNFADFNSMHLDLVSVMDYFQINTDFDSIVLLGICTGAQAALEYIFTGKRKIDHIIELSCPTLWSENTIQKDLSYSKTYFKDYLNKMFQKQTWYKIVRNELNYCLIFNIIKKPIINIINNIKRKIQKINTEPTGNVESTAPKASSISHEKSLNGELLMIHGEKDPETKTSIKQISWLCENNEIPYQIYVVNGANHSFYSVYWEDQIFQIIEKWLYKRFNMNGKNFI